MEAPCYWSVRFISSFSPSSLYLDKTGEKHGEDDQPVDKLINMEVRIVMDELNVEGVVGGVGVGNGAHVLSPLLLQTVACIKPFLEEDLG